MLDRVTPLILTLNEAPNIARTLEQLRWAREVVVVDSCSTDETGDIVRGFKNTRVVERKFTNHAEQWNFGLRETGIASEWVLALDADFVIPERLVREIGMLRPPDDVDGYRCNFVYCIEGRPLRGALYPPVVILFRRERASYLQDGHTQRVSLAGRVEALSAKAFHDDRKPLSQWLASQAGYMRLEARKLRTTPFRDLALADKVRRMIVVAPFAALIYCLLVRGNILDGRRGVFYAIQRATAEAILSLFLLSDRIRAGNSPN